MSFFSKWFNVVNSYTSISAAGKATYAKINGATMTKGLLTKYERVG